MPRPTKKSEYELVFGSQAAKRGWRDLKAAMRGPLADTWDFLTRTPLDTTPANCALKGQLATIVRDGISYQRWQHKPTRQGDARIWFYVHEQFVVLEQVHTAHPNQTKR